MTELVIDWVNAVEYRMPLKRPYGTARGVTRASKNFLVRVLAEHRGARVVGVGESQPRHRLTGDLSIDDAWAFLQAAAETLPGHTLVISDSDSAVQSVRQVMGDLSALALEMSDERNAAKPFRGTLLGIEVALLDLASRALGLPLSQMLGQQRDEVPITVSTLSTQNSAEAFRRKVERQTRYPMVRVKGVGDFDKDTGLLQLVHDTNMAFGSVKPIWMDNNEGFNESEAKRFISHIAEEIKAGRLPEVITLEQPIPKSEGQKLPELQRLADQLTASHDMGEIRIMPDESIWDLDDLDLISGEFGCRAMNIKTAKAGGLLASLDLARRAVALRPDTSICIGGMVGTSDITTWSLLSLAKALPRLDYITAVPPGNVARRISTPLTQFKNTDSNIHLNSDQPGIGGALDEEAVRSYIHRQAWYPLGPGPDDDPLGAERKVVLQPARESGTSPERTFRILFLGDLHYGESYSTGGATVLPERGYQDGTKYLKPFVDRANFTVANLETPIVDPRSVESPLVGQKRFLHWADPQDTPAALKQLGIDAVSLANNHTLDYGRDGLKETLKVLRASGIQVFGAGNNSDEAYQPLTIKLPKRFGGGEVLVHGSMLGSSKTKSAFDSFATDSLAGCSPLRVPTPAPARSPDKLSLNIAFPHWGPNYKWRTPRQLQAARQLLDENVDLVIGHGAHCLQEFGRHRGKWVSYGIGNSHFQAQGRYESFVAKNGILPISFWVMFIVEVLDAGGWRVSCRFYPVHSDNKRTDFQPYPVNEGEFQEVVRALYTRTPHHFDNGRIAGGSDDLGHFLQLEVTRTSAPRTRSDDALPVRFKRILKKVPGAQKGVRRVRRILGSPAQKDRSSAGPDPQPLPATSKSSQVVRSSANDRLLKLVKRGRTLGTQLIADRAAVDGAEAQWYGGATCVVTWENKRLLLQGNRARESSVGAGIIKDKYLTKTFLQQSGARSPEGYLAATSEESVEILERMGRPVVVKPRAGDRGRAVTVNIKTAEEVRRAFNRAEQDASGGVLIEEYIQGTEYRCIVTEAECMSVVNRAQAHIIGDGVSTIAHLIDQKNQVRRENPYLHKKMIPSDEDTLRHLQQQGLTLESVPQQGAKIFVRPVGNFSQGADVVECSDTVGEDLKRTAIEAARAIPGMKWAGVDVVVSEKSGLAYVLEVNSNSGIGSHHFPMKGEPKAIAERIWQERRAGAVADTSNDPDVPMPHETPEHLECKGVRLSELLRNTLSAELGYAVEHLGGGTYKVSKVESPTEWLRGCSSTKDLSAVGSVLSRHGTVRRILEAQKVNLARGRRVRTHHELAEFVAQVDGSVNVVGYLKSWVGARRQTFTAKRVDSVALLLRKSGSLVAQENPKGSRFTVVSTRDAALLVFGRGDEHRVAQRELREVAELAVRAVRAIPELRWAAVDIAMHETNGTDRVYVEGLSSDPLISEGSAVLAGTLRSFAEYVLSG